MKSAASIKGHPIHPILICFPIAFLMGTWICDIINIINEGDNLALTARYLNIAGIISGLLAAIPGIIDFSSTIPPDSSAKKRGAKHGILNTTVIIIYSVALFLRNSDTNWYLIVSLETFAIILLFISGWMGGTLVYKNQIGINTRYADSGKWSEQRTSETNGMAEVEELEKLKVDQMKLVHVGSKRIVVARTETGYVAFDDRCPHKGGSLAGGAMICGTVQCPWHGSQFEVATGKVKAGPSKEPIASYAIVTINGKSFIKLR